MVAVPSLAPSLRPTVRAVAFGMAMVVAGHRLGREAIDVIQVRSPFRPLLLAPLAALVVGLLRARFHRRRVHVHDRDVDMVVVVALLVVGFGITVLLDGRLWWAASVVRLDILTAPVFLGAMVCVLYGTRTAIEQLPTFWVLGSMWPVPYVLLRGSVRVDDIGWLITGWVLATAVVGLFRSGTLCRLRYEVLALTVTTVAVAGAPQWRPLAAFAGVAVVILAARVRGIAWIWQDYSGEPNPSATGTPVRVAGLVVLAAVMASVPGFGLPSRTDPVGVAVPASCADVAGWRPIGQAIVGADEVAHGGERPARRCTYRLDDPAVSRDVAVDVSVPTDVIELGVFPPPLFVEGPGRLDPVERRVGVLGGDVDIYSYADATIPTEVLVAVFHVRVDDTSWRQVRLFVPDDRRPGVEFPDIGNRPVGPLLDRIAVVARTPSDELERYAVEPKDLGLTRRLLHDLVHAWGDEA